MPGPPARPRHSAPLTAYPMGVYFGMNTTSTPATVRLEIDGMSCAHCVQAVTTALAATPGVTVRSVAVGSAVIDSAGPDATQRAIAAIDEAGFAAKPGPRGCGNGGCGCAGR